MVQLKTESLVIRDLFFTDLENIHYLHSLPEAEVHNTLGIPDTLQTTEKLLVDWLEKQKHFQRSCYVLGMELHEINEFLGLIALNLGNPKFKMAEMWYKIHVSTWQDAHTIEALKKLLDFAFNHLNLHRIEVGCAFNNVLSIKALEKVGMTREGKKRKFLPMRGEWIDCYLYSILDEDFGLKI